MNLIVSLVIILALQYGLSYIFAVLLGFNYYVTDTLINLCLALLFSFWNYRNGTRANAIKDPTFHKSVLLYFIVLMVFSLIFWLM